MIRLIALWAGGVAVALLLLILREERLAAQGKVPMGRLRRLWWGSQRRRHPRYRFNWPLRYTRADSETVAFSTLQNLSQAGAGLMVFERLPAGSLLHLELFLPDRAQPLQVAGEVVWSRPVPAHLASDDPPRAFFVGVRFCDPLPVDIRALASGQGKPSEASPPRDESSQQAKAYARLRRIGWLAETALSLGVVGWFLFSGSAKTLARWITACAWPWPVEVAAFMGSVAGLVTLLLFPLEVWQGFHLEHRFGLSTQPFREWLKDYAKGLGVAALLGGLLVEGLAWLLRWNPQQWWGWATAFWLIWSVGLTRVAPQWLIPLFYRQKPVTDPSLQERLKQLMARCRMPIHGIFEINLSRSTRKANACLCGWGASRRVLLSDTLLAQYPPEEVEVVLAHEVGHHRGHHLGLLIACSAFFVGLSCAAVDRWVRAQFGLHGLEGRQDPVTLLAIGWGFSVIQLALLPALNGISRLLEAQADRFALTTTHNPTAFIEAMRRLAKQNLAEVDPPRWVEWLFYDHPPIAKRIAFAQEFFPMQEKEGKRKDAERLHLL